MRRFKLSVELLESREVLSTTMLEAPLLMDPLVTSTTETVTSDAPTIEIIDPTATPATPGDTSVCVQITELGDVTGDRIFSITVQGLQPENVQFSGVMSFTLGGTTYAVDAAFARPDGQYDLIVLGGVDASSLTLGSNLMLLIGTGGSSTPTTPPAEETPPPQDPPPAISVIDPTEAPVGG